MIYLALLCMSLCVQAPKEATPPPPSPTSPSETEALASLRRAENLLSLRLRIDIIDKEFDDAQLAKLVPLLAALPDLRELDLGKTAVTAEGLIQLKAMKQLRLLVVPLRLLRSKAVAELQEANAKLIVAPASVTPGKRDPVVDRPNSSPPK